MNLNKANLVSLLADVSRPHYNREALQPSIVHIGVGGFHRTHQAVYLHELLNKGVTDWAICGMGIRRMDDKIHQVLKAQDYLYTVIEKHPDGKIQPLIIGSIVDFIFVPQNPAAAIEKLSDPQTKILSLTITEGGYNFDEHGEFVMDHPDIQWDLQHPESPKTVFGLIASALRRRMEKNLPSFTILSCDNIQHNGNVIRKMMLSFTNTFDTSLSDWISNNTAFPNCMVDRITPVTTQEEIDFLRKNYKYDDAWPVTCEPFIQWVMEDNFSAGRPEWEKVGVQFVEDIEPYEKMKLRLLNAGHSLLGMTGMLYNHSTINEAANDKDLPQLLRDFMDLEVSPILGSIKNIDLQDYKDTLIERFSNPNIKDQLNRICGESSAKLPKFLIPTIQEQLLANGPIKRGVLVLAAWCHILETYDLFPDRYSFHDVMLHELIAAAKGSGDSNELHFIRLQSVFGNLAENPRFVNEYVECIRNIREKGIKTSVQKLLK